MNPHDRVRLRHIVDALNAAMRFVDGRKRSDLDTDEMLLFALVRAIEIVGEAASKVTAETRAAMPDLPGRRLSACEIDSCMPTSISIAIFYGQQ
jgi:uncharacterized protein with HEPN domain